jgi:hypothetical protein
MHGRFVLLIALFSVSVFISQASWASGNVLLPSDGSSSSQNSTSLPNLGLVPNTPSANTVNTVNTGPLLPVNPPPAFQTKGTNDGGMSPAPIKEQDILSPVDKASAAHLPPGAIPTQIIHQPDTSSYLTDNPGNKPYKMTLSISNRSIFGAGDVAAITKKLGLTQSQITSNCVLSLRGLMMTDKDSILIDGGTTPQAIAYYDGAIHHYVITAAALCTADHLPPGIGLVTEEGDRFFVPLQAINCPPPTRQSAQLIITYNGSGSSQCVYQ